MAQVEQLSEIIESIEITAPATRVFAALTQPAELLAWWSGGEVCPLASFESDLRPGGSWKKAGVDNDGDAFYMAGEYTIVEPPHLLEFTWRTGMLVEAGVGDTIVRYELAEQNGATTLTVRHSGFIRESDRTNHANGWKAVLALLPKHFH